MTAEKKDKSVKTKCAPHQFAVTGWNIKGGKQNATQMRCSHCLMAVCLEELESKEWQEQQGI